MAAKVLGGAAAVALTAGAVGLTGYLPKAGAKPRTPALVPAGTARDRQGREAQAGWWVEADGGWWAKK